MLVRLRYLAHDLEVPFGQFVIGRSAECQLSLEDPLVSRRHAVLTVRYDAVLVEDLGSRNGVLVNGVKIEGPRALEDGDVVTIGSQDMTVSCNRARAPMPTALDLETGVHPTMLLEDLREDDDDPPTRIGQGPISSPSKNPDKRVNGLTLIGGVAEKALALGRVEDAARLLQRSLYDVVEKARKNEPVDADLAESAAHYAARLAGATNDGTWLDYVFELYTLRAEVLPAPIVDELYVVVRKVRAQNRHGLHDYIARLATETERFGPAERFLQQRIEGLERLGMLK